MHERFGPGGRTKALERDLAEAHQAIRRGAVTALLGLLGLPAMMSMVEEE